MARPPASTNGGSAPSSSRRRCSTAGATITPTRNGRRGPRAASRSEWSLWLCVDRLGAFVAGAESERHRAVNDDPAVDAGHAAEHAHPASQASDDGLDDDLIAWVNGPAIPHALDSHEVDQFFPVLRLRQDHDCADLRDGLLVRIEGALVVHLVATGSALFRVTF